jgi:hypothetical protein
MGRANLLVQLSQGRHCLFRQGKPLLILNARRMSADIAFHDIGGEGSSVQEFMAPK